MASVKPRPNPTDAASAGNNGRAAIYRERAAHLRAMAEAERDPELRAQLLDLARQYEDMADSAGPHHRTEEMLWSAGMRCRA
jgi:hypothetical protein